MRLPHSKAALVALALALTLVAFAANSLLTRAALDGQLIGPAAFVLVRLWSGALFLCLLIRPQPLALWPRGWAAWGGLISLLIYALGFTLAYLHLATGLGALVLFGAVQLTLIAVGLWRGEAFGPRQAVASALALSGLVVLVWSGQGAGPLWAWALMLAAGIAWAAQTALGQVTGAGTAAQVVMTRNFVWAALFCVPLVLLVMPGQGTPLTAAGLTFSLASGTLASGLGYVLWYWVLPQITTLLAGVSQLLVPIIAAFAGLIWLQEPLGWRFIIAATLVISGVLLTLLTRKPPGHFADNGLQLDPRAA